MTEFRVLDHAKTWRQGLEATCSLLAFGVPMAREAWQVSKDKFRYLDMWKPGYDLATLPITPDSYRYPTPNAHCLK